VCPPQTPVCARRSLSLCPTMPASGAPLLALGLIVGLACPAAAFLPHAVRLPTSTRTPLSTLRSRPVTPRPLSVSSSLLADIQTSLFPNKQAPLPFPPSSSITSDKDKVGILFLNLGGPESLDEVEDFLYNLFNDPDIIRLPGPLKPLQSVIARRIASSRAPNSREAYESIGGGSPIVQFTLDQGEKLEEELRRRGIKAKTYVGMRYWYPFTEEAVDQLLKDEVNRLVVIPLYPQYSISTSGSSLRLLDQLMEDHPSEWDPRKIDHTVVPAWFDNKGYVDTQAKLIGRELEEFSANPQDVKVLFSAHGVPVSYVEAGDPYKGQIEQCTKLIMDRVNRDRSTPIDHKLCFQSRVGPVKWLEPYTDDVLNELGASGLENLVVVPLSFVSEHVETLEEIDIEYREVALEAGITNFKRVPALNIDADFISCLADLTTDALTKPSLRVSEALALYQGKEKAPAKPASWFTPGVSTSSEAINGRVAMLAISALAVSRVMSSGCPAISGPSIAGKEPFCAAFSYDGWAWLFDVIQTLHI